MCELSGSCWEGGTAAFPCALGVATGATRVHGQMLREATESILQLLRVPLWVWCLLAAPRVPSCTRALELLKHCRGQSVPAGKGSPRSEPRSVSGVQSASHSRSVFPLLHTNLNLYCV